MLKPWKRLQNIYSECTPQTKIKYIRIGGLALIKFWLMVIYAIVRPATSSLFLEAHTNEGLPIAWILVTLGMTGAVLIYNRFVGRMDLLKLFGWIAFLSACVLVVILFACSERFPGAYYVMYMWKDIHVVILVEAFYSFANSVFPLKTARWVYGFFGAMGAFGAMCGNLVVGPLAQHFGSFQTLYFVPPMLLISWLGALPFARTAGIGKPLDGLLDTKKVKNTVNVIKRSPYLFLILLLIPLIQIVMTLIDFEFQTVLQNNFSDVDVRTGIFGKVYAVTSFLTVALNIFTGPVLRLIGVPIALFIVPMFLGVGVGAFALYSRFAVISVVKVASKTFDYTLLRASKEMLYIPLTYAEKTVGKSVVDMLGYRAAKGLASVMLLALIALHLQGAVSLMTFAVIAVWVAIVAAIVVRFRRKVTRDREMHSDEVETKALVDMPRDDDSKDEGDLEQLQPAPAAD